MSDDPDTAYRKAKERLGLIGPALEGYIGDQIKAILTSNPNDVEARETAYRHAYVAGEIKKRFAVPVEEYETELAVQKHKEAKNGPREQHHN